MYEDDKSKLMQLKSTGFERFRINHFKRNDYKTRKILNEIEQCNMYFILACFKMVIHPKSACDSPMHLRSNEQRARCNWLQVTILTCFFSECGDTQTSIVSVEIFVVVDVVAVVSQPQYNHWNRMKTKLVEQSVCKLWMKRHWKRRQASICVTMIS